MHVDHRVSASYGVEVGVDIAVADLTQQGFATRSRSLDLFAPQLWVPLAALVGYQHDAALSEVWIVLWHACQHAGNRPNRGPDPRRLLLHPARVREEVQKDRPVKGSALGWFTRVVRVLGGDVRRLSANPIGIPEPGVRQRIPRRAQQVGKLVDALICIDSRLSPIDPHEVGGEDDFVTGPVD